MDITDANSVRNALELYRPWAVINAAGYVRVDDAQTDPCRCYAENTWGPILLADACCRIGIPIVTFSTDLVFDGTKGEPYLENDTPNPLSVYGRSKAWAEQAILDVHCDAMLIRTSAFFGPWDEYNLLTLMFAALARGEAFPAISDCKISPTYVPDLIDASLDLLIDEERGIIHLANQGVVSWYEFACMAAHAAGVDDGRICPIALADAGLTAPRPAYTVLGSLLKVMPPVERALLRYLQMRPIGPGGRSLCPSEQEAAA
jgi:dTDP-4-dehydrorhamnose reductase